MTTFVLREATDLVDQLTQLGNALEGEDRAYWEREITRKVPSLKFDFETMTQDVDVVNGVGLFHQPLAREFLAFFTDENAPWVVDGDVVVSEFADLVNALETIVAGGRQATIDAMADVRANIVEWTVRHIDIAQNLAPVIDSLVQDEVQVGRDFRKEMYLKVAQNIEGGELPLQSRYVREAMVMLFGDRASEYAASLGIEAKSTVSSPRSKEAAAFLASVGMKLGALGTSTPPASMLVGLLMGELVLALQDVLATPAVTDIFASTPAQTPTDPNEVPPSPVPSVPSLPILPPRLVDPIMGEKAEAADDDPLAAEINAILGILNAALVLLFGKDRSTDLRSALGLALLAVTPTEAPVEGLEKEIQDSVENRHGDLVALVGNTFGDRTIELQSLGFFAGAADLVSGIWDAAPFLGSLGTYAVGVGVGVVAYVLFAPRFGSGVAMRTRTAAVALSLYTSFGAVMALNFVGTESELDPSVRDVGGAASAAMIFVTVPTLVASSMIAVMGLVRGAVTKRWGVRVVGALGIVGMVYAILLLRGYVSDIPGLEYVTSGFINQILNAASWPLFAIWSFFAFSAVKIVDGLLYSASVAQPGRINPTQRNLVKSILRHTAYGMTFFYFNQLAAPVLQIPFGPQTQFQSEWTDVLRTNSLALEQRGFGNLGVFDSRTGFGFARTVWQQAGPGQLANSLVQTTFLAPLVVPLLSPYGLAVGSLVLGLYVYSLLKPDAFRGLRSSIDRLTENFIPRGFVGQTVWRGRPTNVTEVYVQDDDGEIYTSDVTPRTKRLFEQLGRITEGLVAEAGVGVQQARDIAEYVLSASSEAASAVANMASMTPLMSPNTDDEDDDDDDDFDEGSDGRSTPTFEALIGEPLVELEITRSPNPLPIYFMAVSIKLARRFDPSTLGLPSTSSSFKIPTNPSGNSVYGPVSTLSQSRRRPAQPINTVKPNITRG